MRHNAELCLKSRNRPELSSPTVLTLAACFSWTVVLSSVCHQPQGLHSPIFLTGPGTHLAKCAKQRDGQGQPCKGCGNGQSPLVPIGPQWSPKTPTASLADDRIRGALSLAGQESLSLVPSSLASLGRCAPPIVTTSHPVAIITHTSIDRDTVIKWW